MMSNIDNLQCTLVNRRRNVLSRPTGRTGRVPLCNAAVREPVDEIITLVTERSSDFYQCDNGAPTRAH